MPRKADPATIRVVVKFTQVERDALFAHCEDEVRTAGSWFRLMVRRAWKTRKPPKRPPPYQRNQGDGVHREVDIWARLTETERDRLDILTGDAGVSISVWFRRQLDEDIARAGGRRRFTRSP